MKKIIPCRKEHRLDQEAYRGGCFFITINAQDRDSCLGYIRKRDDDICNDIGYVSEHPTVGESRDSPDQQPQSIYVDLTVQGKIVRDQRLWLAKQYPYVQLLERVVMPDHMHGIIVIEDRKGMVIENQDKINVGASREVSVQGRSIFVEDGYESDEPLYQDRSAVGVSRDSPLQNPLKRKGLSSLIGAFKTTSSKLIRRTGYTDFKRQRSFYDRIIYDRRALYYTQEYIKNNPRKRYEDRYI